MNISVRHSLSVWRRNLSMYRRTWKLNLLPNFFEPVLYLVSIGVGLGGYITAMGGMSYVEFLAPGLVCVAAMNGASFEVTYNFYVRLTFEKTYDAMLTTPLQPQDILLGEILWAVTRACIYGGCFFVVVIVAGLAPMPWSLWVVPLIPVVGVLFAAIGLAFTLRIPNIDLFSFYFTLFLTPLFLFSSVFFPLEERFPRYWLWIAEALPLLHPVRVARAAFHGAFSSILIWDMFYILIVCFLLIACASSGIKRRLTN